MEIRLHYEALLALLEAAYARVRLDHPVYGDRFRAAWDRARKDVCQAHGWTVRDFYAELDRRRAEIRSSRSR